MIIALINIKTNICENIAIFDDLDIANEMFGEIYTIADVESNYGIGDYFKDGIWSKNSRKQDLTEEDISVDASLGKKVSIPRKLISLLMNAN